MDEEGKLKLIAALGLAVTSINLYVIACDKGDKRVQDQAWENLLGAASRGNKVMNDWLEGTLGEALNTSGEIT